MPDRFRPGLTGFVAYMSRKDAEDALARFEGYTLNGNRLRVSWSKPVSLPSQPAYGKFASACQLIVGSLNPESRRPHVNPHSTHSRSRSPPRAKSNRDQADATRDYWLDQVPAEETKFIQEVSKRIRDHGPGLIETLKERESANPKFNFLLDEKVRAVSKLLADAQAAAFHAFQYFLDRRYTFPDPPPPSFNDEVSLESFNVTNLHPRVMRQPTHLTQTSGPNSRRPARSQSESWHSDVWKRCCVL